MLKPIKKKRLFEEIIVEIEKFIQEEKIQPGDKLPSEFELASIFNVSKTSVREALSVLHSNGITESRPGIGIYLKKNAEGSIVNQVAANLLGKKELNEVFEFRRGIEVEAVSLAAQRATAVDLQSIQKANEDLVLANQQGSIGVKEDYLFHYSIILASHNSIYKDIFDTLSHKFEQGIRTSKMQSVNLPGLLKEGTNEHEKIIDALLNHDSNLASQTMRKHLIRTQKKVWALFNATT